MIDELYPFQKRAVSELRVRIASAMGTYKNMHIPQVISLQAPTGSGKTIIMTALIEDILFGTDNYIEQPEAIFVWLSDSPALNEQSKQKIETKADKIKMSQCVTIEDSSFDMEILEDGKIYFLNTQKLGKGANLGNHGDGRTFTIWETLENTAREKSDRLYFIIDEAHRGMHDNAAGVATSIMQRFIKGSTPHKLSPMPLIIGMSATVDRFNNLIGDWTQSTLNKVVVQPAEVKSSGLLKERIVITYPDDPAKNNDMAVLQAATDEWLNKCIHWDQYSEEQHDTKVHPVFVIQVKAGSGDAVSDSNLDDIIAKIEERMGSTFGENEVVHTFGSTGTLTLNGLTVNHVEPTDITDDKRIRLVLFKENLSTGWDCPRAETMMSFRAAEDKTYVAQLLGRMVRTPLRKSIKVDEYLNDVRLYLPYYNASTVKDVVNELQATEGGEIPTIIDEESLENPTYVQWTVRNPARYRRADQNMPGQISLFDGDNGQNNVAPPVTIVPTPGPSSVQGSSGNPIHNVTPITRTVPSDSQSAGQTSTATPVIEVDNTQYEQMELHTGIDREEVTDFINRQGYITYIVRRTRINGYLKSLLSLASILSQNAIHREAIREVRSEIAGFINDYITGLKQSGTYESKAKEIIQFKLSIKIFDIFGESLDGSGQQNFFATSDSDLDRQLRIADSQIGNAGIVNDYANKYYEDYMDMNWKIDCILFVTDEESMSKLEKYAKDRFHDLDDTYRVYIVSRSEQCKKQYSDIVRDGDPVSKHNFSLPEITGSHVPDDGKKYYNHLFLEDGKDYAVIKLNGWEDELIEKESQRPDFVCWIRNSIKNGLCIPYEIDGETKAMYPDFIVVRRDDQLGYVIDILEPHGDQYKDNLGKAKGLAKYAEAEPRIARIQLIRKSGNKFIRLDLTKGNIRQKVLGAVNNDELDHYFDTDGIE